MSVKFWAYDIEFHGAGDSEDPNRVTEVLHFDKSGDPGHEEPANADQRYPQATEEESVVADRATLAESEDVDPKAYVSSGFIIRYDSPELGTSYVFDRDGTGHGWDHTQNKDLAELFFTRKEAQHVLNRLHSHFNAPIDGYSIEQSIKESEEEVDPKAFVSSGYVVKYTPTQPDVKPSYVFDVGGGVRRKLFMPTGTWGMTQDIAEAEVFFSEAEAKEVLAKVTHPMWLKHYSIEPVNESEEEEVDPKEFLDNKFGWIAYYTTSSGNTYLVAWDYEYAGGLMAMTWTQIKEKATRFSSENEARDAIEKLDIGYHNLIVELVPNDNGVHESEEEEVDPKEFLANKFGWIVIRDKFVHFPQYLVAWEHKYAGGDFDMQGTWTPNVQDATRFESEEKAKETIARFGIEYLKLTVELVANDNVPEDDMRPKSIGERVMEAPARQPAYMIRIGDGVRTKYFCTDGSKSWWSDHYEDAAALPHADAVAQIDVLKARKHMQASVIRLESIDEPVNESHDPFDDDGLPGEVSTFLRKSRSRRKSKRALTL